ncbi:MAG: cryptochrome/photolyase family protein [Legionellaceae bacterium]|nr:cryptochrome/photolyase family protein [Legionellaceae bacterium]
MKTLCMLLGDQLSLSIASLKGCDRAETLVLMCEVWEEATYVKHHKKKIAFLFSAMRHFAETLANQGYHTVYTTIDDEHNSGSLKGEVARVLEQHQIERIILTHPGEYRVLADMQTWESDFGIPVEIRADDRFLCSLEEFADWAKGRKQLRMEYFYREMRKKHAILMEGDMPIGGQWNYDADNRKPPKKDMNIPKPYHPPVDPQTRVLMERVATLFPEHFGALEPFSFAVTRAHALQVFERFLAERLPCFGDYQDAMLEGEPWMYHSHISFYLNCGLLLPLECVQAVENAYQQGLAPLNAVEGFIRQVIGWREYVRGIYWLNMPKYAEENFFNARRSLPAWYWTADTKMNCLRQCVLETRRNAYAHHIQRLMILGNFALIAGIEPRQVNEWFLVVYADAYEWVELPNVSGMILFADGGYLASKPYAAGGRYINKMSDYCKQCSYKVTQKSGPDACPFNYLYWDFIARNHDKLHGHHRMQMIYQTYARMPKTQREAMANDSAAFLNALP